MNKYIFGLAPAIFILCISCGIKTDLLLDPPEYLENFNTTDYTEFTHTRQVNDSSFLGYLIFYKIFDTNTLSYDLTDTDEGGGIDDFVNNFKSSGAMSLSYVDNIIFNGIYDLSAVGRYCFLYKIDESIEIPDNNNDDHKFIIKSSTGNTLISETRLLYTNDVVVSITDRELYRHFIDDNNNQILRTFSLDSFQADNDDRDLPSISNGGTIDFENVTENFELVIAFVGIAYGVSDDPQKFGQTILSEPRFLGTIHLDK